MDNKILLVDDDLQVLKSLENLLKKQNYRVTAAEDGFKAVEAAKKDVFDLVITDIRMPKMDGIEVIKKIKEYQSQFKSQKSEFMVITGFADDDAPKQGASLGINNFSVKPFEVTAFLNAVKDCLEGKKSDVLKSGEELSKETPINLPNKYFSLEKTVFLKSTNLMGNTYFANYILWQGEVREAALMSHPNFAQEMEKNQQIKMITHSLYHRFTQETTFGDIVEIRMTTREIKRCSLVLVFRYHNKRTDAFLGEGWQRITFVNLKTGGLTAVPKFIRDLAIAVCEDKS